MEGAEGEGGDVARPGNGLQPAGTFPEAAEFPGISLISPLGPQPPRPGVSQPLRGRPRAQPRSFSRSFLRFDRVPEVSPLRLQPAFLGRSGRRGGKFGEPTEAPLGSPEPAGGRGGRGCGRHYCIRFAGRVGTANKGDAPSPSAVDLGANSLAGVQDTRLPLLRGHRLGERPGSETSHPPAQRPGAAQRRPRRRKRPSPPFSRRWGLAAGVGKL